MTQKQPETMLEVLESTLNASRSYEEFVADGAALQKLSAMPEFRRFQRIVAEAYLALIERMRLASGDQLAQLQGALIQHHNLMKLPTKIVESATQIVQQRRSDQEGDKE